MSHSIARTCSNCAASVPPRTDRCPYCGTWFEEGPALPSSSVSVNPQAGEFGWRGRVFWGLALTGIGGLYWWGWRFEDTQYWLDTRAMLVWTLALPIWLAAVACAWRTWWGAWLGIGLGVVIFGTHLGVMVALDGHFFDDQAGIAAMIAGAGLAGWTLGRVLHGAIRRARARR